MAGEKTEQPTPKKLRDSRQKGQVARSQEVVTTLSLFGVLALIYAMFSQFWVRLVNMMDVVAGLAARDPTEGLLPALSTIFNESVAIMAPILGVTIFLAIAGNYIQFGAIFSPESVRPKLEKISISKGFGRIFSMKQVVEMLKSLAKIIFLSVLLYFVIRAAIGPFMTAIACGLFCLSTVTSVMMIQILLFSALAFIIVAGLDYMFQRHSHTKSLMMSKDEVKREYKESEGDPLVKGQRKQLAQELVMSDVKKQVPRATAVVVNPTHLAIAIRYDPDHAPLPMVVAKGRMLHAVDIRREAELAGVPIFRNVPLAHLLYAETELNDYVPDEAFDLIAEILAWVKRHEQKLYNGPLQHGDLDMALEDHKA